MAKNTKNSRKEVKKSGGSSGQNRKNGDAYLDKYRKKEGVKETDSGLLYEVVSEGSGDCPFANSNVVVHQRAMLVGGKMLDDTYKENKPMEFCLSDVIDGYAEGLQMMRAGSRYKFVIPPDLAWGKKGSGGSIGPNAVIVFDVHLIEFW